MLMQITPDDSDEENLNMPQLLIRDIDFCSSEDSDEENLNIPK